MVAIPTNNTQMKGIISTPLYFLSSLPAFLLDNYAELIGTVCLVASTIYLVLNNRKGVKLKQAQTEQAIKEAKKTELESTLLLIEIEKARSKD